MKIVATDGFTGFKTAPTEEIPKPTTVMDPFHLIRLAGNAPDACRRRVQAMVHGNRGRKHHLLYQARRTPHTRADLVTDKQQRRLGELFGDDRHVEVELTWGIYQRMITAYHATSRTAGNKVMTSLIDATSTPTPTSPVKVAKSSRTSTKRRDDILAFFDHPASSNSPTETNNGRLEHLHGTALGFPNLTHHTTRSLLETDKFRPDLHPRS